MPAVKQKRVIFFTEGMVPNDAERKEIEGFEGIVMVRNAQAVGPNDPIENADEFLGAVPDRYKKADSLRDQMEPRSIMHMENPSAARDAKTGEEPDDKIINDYSRGRRNFGVNDPETERELSFEDREREASKQAESDQWRTSGESGAQPGQPEQSEQLAKDYQPDQQTATEASGETSGDSDPFISQNQPTPPAPRNQPRRR